jgi:hypothetical protein
MLKDTPGREAWGRNAQRRIHQRFLVFSQLRDWIGLLSTLV